MPLTAVARLDTFSKWLSRRVGPRKDPTLYTTSELVVLANQFLAHTNPQFWPETADELVTALRSRWAMKAAGTRKENKKRKRAQEAVSSQYQLL